MKSRGLRKWTGNYRVEAPYLSSDLSLPLGVSLAFLVGFDAGAVVFMVLGRFDDGDSGMRFVGLRVGVGQTGAAVGQP